MSSDLKYMAQTTYVILPKIVPSYQIRQKKGWHPWWESNPRPPVRPIEARFGPQIPPLLYSNNESGDRVTPVDLFDNLQESQFFGFKHSSNADSPYASGSNGIKK